MKFEIETKITLCGEVALEEAMNISQHKSLNE
jgi:hypothetical protein